MRQRRLASVTLFLVLVILSACARPTATAVPTSVKPPPAVAERPTAAAALPTSAPATPTAAPATEVVTKPASSPGDWPMFRFSLDRAGYNPNETTLKPPLSLKWQYKTGSKI